MRDREDTKEKVLPTHLNAYTYPISRDRYLTLSSHDERIDAPPVVEDDMDGQGNP